MLDNFAPPAVTVVQTAFEPDRTTRVESVTLDSNGLSISVSSQRWDARVRFEQTYGFRVLDELDLTEFWSRCTLDDGWLFEVTSGGWKELELTRPYFYSGRQDWVREYLVVGLNECVSVLTKEVPSVLATAPSDPSLQPTAFGGG